MKAAAASAENIEFFDLTDVIGAKWLIFTTSFVLVVETHLLLRIFMDDQACIVHFFEMQMMMMRGDCFVQNFIKHTSRSLRLISIYWIVSYFSCIFLQCNDNIKTFDHLHLYNTGLGENNGTIGQIALFECFFALQWFRIRLQGMCPQTQMSQ